MNVHEASNEWRHRRQKYFGEIGTHPVALIRRMFWGKSKLGIRPGIPGQGCVEYFLDEGEDPVIRETKLTFEDLEATDWEVVDFPLGKPPLYEDPGNLSKRGKPKKSPLKLLTEDRSLGFFFTCLAEEVGRVDGNLQRRDRQDFDEHFVQWFLEQDNFCRVARAASGIALTSDKDAENPSFSVEERIFFAGAGEMSRRDARRLIDRLEYALLLRSGTQQQGLQGTDYDHEQVASDDHDIRLVLEDIAYALFGEKAREFMTFTDKT